MISEWERPGRSSISQMYSYARRESVYIARKKLAGIKVPVRVNLRTCFFILDFLQPFTFFIFCGGRCFVAANSMKNDFN